MSALETREDLVISGFSAIGIHEDSLISASRTLATPKESVISAFSPIETCEDSIISTFSTLATLFVDSLQVRPSVVGGEAGIMAEHAPLTELSRIIMPTIYLLPGTSLHGHRIYMYTEHGTTCSIFGPVVFFLCSIQFARNIVRLFFRKEHALDREMICFPYLPGTLTFDFAERRVLVPHAKRRSALGYSRTVMASTSMVYEQ